MLSCKYRFFTVYTPSLLSIVGNLGISLFLFNVGIEIGQLIVIPIVLAFIWLLNRSNITRGSYLISSYLIGGIGMFWLIERITNIVI